MTSSLCCDLLLRRNSAVSNCHLPKTTSDRFASLACLVGILVFALFLTNRDCGPFPCVNRYWLDLTSSDTFWNTSDTGWAKSAWSSIFSPWIQGACVFVHKMPHFNPSIVFEVSEESPAANSTVLSGSSCPGFHFPWCCTEGSTQHS